MLFSWKFLEDVRSRGMGLSRQVETVAVGKTDGE